MTESHTEHTKLSMAEVNSLAIFDSVVLARVAHELRVQGVVPLRATPIDLDSIEPECVKGLDVTLVVFRQLHALAACTPVQVPAKCKSGVTLVACII